MNTLHAAIVAGLMSATVMTGVDAAESSTVYDKNCSLCHQKEAIGLAGQFPRLAGRANQISATAAGRRYLVQVALFGMAGKIDIDGTSIVGVMPAFVALSDEDIASALNYVIGLNGPANGKAKGVPVSAADIGSVRAGEQLTPTQVRTERETLAVARMK